MKKTKWKGFVRKEEKIGVLRDWKFDENIWGEKISLIPIGSKTNKQFYSYSRKTLNSLWSVRSQFWNLEKERGGRLSGMNCGKRGPWGTHPGSPRWRDPLTKKPLRFEIPTSSQWRENNNPLWGRYHSFSEKWMLYGEGWKNRLISLVVSIWPRLRYFPPSTVSPVKFVYSKKEGLRVGS